MINFKPFFYEKILHAQQAQNAHKRTKIKKAAFLCAQKTSKGKIVTYSPICVLCFCLIVIVPFSAFGAFSAFCAFCFFVLFLLFVVFVHAKSFRKKNEGVR